MHLLIVARTVTKGGHVKKVRRIVHMWLVLFCERLEHVPVDSVKTVLIFVVALVTAATEVWEKVKCIIFVVFVKACSERFLIRSRKHLRVPPFRI